MLIENIIKNTFLRFTPGRKSKYLQSYDRNTIFKNYEKQKKFKHKMASPKKLQKCRFMTFFHSHFVPLRSKTSTTLGFSHSISYWLVAQHCTFGEPITLYLWEWMWCHCLCKPGLTHAGYNRYCQFEIHHRPLKALSKFWCKFRDLLRHHVHSKNVIEV